MSRRRDEEWLIFLRSFLAPASASATKVSSSLSCALHVALLQLHGWSKIAIQVCSDAAASEARTLQSETFLRKYSTWILLAL